MEEKIMLTIEGVQSDPQGERSEITLVTEGVMTRLKQGARLKYQESEIVGTQGAHMVIELDDGAVLVSREGEYGSHFFFRKGERCTNLYQTPYGTLQMHAYPTEVSYSLRDDGGELSLRYHLEVQGQNVGSNQLHIQWKSPI